MILHWLKEQYNCEVVCFAADLGQGEELEPLEAKAAAAGSRIYIDDLRRVVSDCLAGGARQRPV